MSYPYKPPRTPEKQTRFFNPTDNTSSIDPAQSLGEIRKRLAQGSLKILGLEISDEGPEMEEAVIQPSIETPASINVAPGATKPRGTIAGWNKRLLQIAHFYKVPKNLSDPTWGLSLLLR